MSDVTTETQAAKKFDPEVFALNLARAMESSGQALAAYLKPRESGESKDKPPSELAEVIKTLSAVGEYWLSDNERATELQTRIGKAYLDLWGSSARRLAGEQAPPAIAPSPRETLTSSGDNLAPGMKMLAEDIEAGRGTMRIRHSDPANLVVGVNMATTPGKVIYQNDLMQLIQYRPATENVLRTPLLIVPPWINKFYILDLKPEKSFIKWCVDQGVTVFVISWVNPDKSLGAKTFDDYMKEGPLAAMDAIEKATGELKVHTMGYCVGGTLLASTLAWLAEKRRVRATSATFLAAQVDFTHAGDLLVFVDEGQISALERDMQSSGVLEGARMAMAFNMLRSNDLIWSYVVSNYLKGQPPSAFDLLHWNSDATRMPAANHSYYLRNCYLENRLSTGSMVLDNTLLDLSKVKVPIYNLATREDHIAPADSVLYGSQFFGGPVKYVMSGSGHIAGAMWSS